MGLTDITTPTLTVKLMRIRRYAVVIRFQTLEQMEVEQNASCAGNRDVWCNGSPSSMTILEIKRAFSLAETMESNLCKWQCDPTCCKNLLQLLLLQYKVSVCSTYLKT